MTDVFGNYVIQKFVEFGSEEHQRKILMVVLPNVETLSVQMYGCRVIQKLLDTLSMEQKKIIFRVRIKENNAQVCLNVGFSRLDFLFNFRASFVLLSLLSWKHKKIM